MPIINTILKSDVEKHQKALENLEMRLGDKKIEEEYIFEIGSDSDEYRTNEGPAMLAVAKLKNGTYVAYGPKYLEEEQLVVFDFLLREIEVNANLFVFSNRDYEAVEKYRYEVAKKYLYGKEVNVKILR